LSGRSPIAGHFRGHQEVLGYFGARRAHAKATFRVLPRAILPDDQQAVHLADGRRERDGQLRTWQTVGVFRIAGGKIADAGWWPFDQSCSAAADTEYLRRRPGHGREGIDTATEQPEILKAVKPSAW
jgi:hypothetical protein